MIKLYNSLAREKQPFMPIDPRHVRLYACGPTVYNYAHIGNARMAVVFDLLTRLLRGVYPKVTYVSNITDVEDKIIEASRQTGEAIEEITQKYTRIYNEDMAALAVLPPDVQPLATEHIGEMISLIEKLIAKGHAYVAEEENTNRFHVLFNVPSDPTYGALSGRSRDEQIAGARVEVAPYKKDPADFVLWKPSSGDEPGWDSPWGFGRPGWHIECSAMAEKHLGLPFDIHGGGADLKFPHHENEIAQSCCAHGTENDPSSFAKIWVHNGFLTVEGEKMSKSIGNIRLVHELLKEHKGEVLRLALLGAHYRQPLDWSEQAVNQAKKQLDTFYGHLYGLRDVEAEKAELPGEVAEALKDDLNTPLAISRIHTVLKEETSKPLLKGKLLAIGKIMGILQHDPAQWLGYGGETSEEVEALIEKRQAAKKAKDFALADALRKQIEDMGILLEDTPQGTKWRQKSA
jgi:cysteinyl-tRNA synthetase